MVNAITHFPTTGMHIYFSKNQHEPYSAKIILEAIFRVPGSWNIYEMKRKFTERIIRARLGNIQSRSCNCHELEMTRFNFNRAAQCPEATDIKHALILYQLKSRFRGAYEVSRTNQEHSEKLQSSATEQSTSLIEQSHTYIAF